MGAGIGKITVRSALELIFWMNYDKFKFKAEYLWEMSCQELNALVKSNSDQNVANLGNERY